MADVIKLFWWFLGLFLISEEINKKYILERSSEMYFKRNEFFEKGRL